MRRIPDKQRNGAREAAAEPQRSSLDELRKEIRRRSDEMKLYRSLTHDYPQRG
jgi:hypothetical protein